MDQANVAASAVGIEIRKQRVDLARYIRIILIGGNNYRCLLCRLELLEAVWVGKQCGDAGTL